MALLDVIDSHPLVMRATELRPLLQSSRAEAEAMAHMAPAVRKAFGDEGMFRLAAPREVGGHELRLSTMAAVVHELAVGDPGAAWHLANSPMAGLAAASLSAAARARVFAQEDTCYSYSAIPGGRAVPVTGGAELSGRWPFVTGIRDAGWVVLSGMLQHGEDPPRPRDLRLFLVPADKVIVEDTWSGAAALRSSGSNAVRAEGILVEDELTVSFTQPRVLDRSLYRIPSQMIFTASAATIAVGVLRAALDATIRECEHETVKLHRRPLVGPCARADHRRPCRGNASLSPHWAAGRAGPARRPLHGQRTGRARERAVAWGVMLHVVDQAREALSSLAGSASSQAFMVGHRFEAAVRDIHAILVAMEHMRPLEQAAGGVLLGAPPGSPVF